MVSQVRSKDRDGRQECVPLLCLGRRFRTSSPTAGYLSSREDGTDLPRSGAIPVRRGVSTSRTGTLTETPTLTQEKIPHRCASARVVTRKGRSDLDGSAPRDVSGRPEGLFHWYTPPHPVRRRDTRGDGKVRTAQGPAESRVRGGCRRDRVRVDRVRWSSSLGTPLGEGRRVVPRG